MDSFQQELTATIIAFRDARNWAQFHNGKDIAISLSVEANELLELFLWKTDDSIPRAKLQEELADVLYALLLLSDKYNIDLRAAFEEKMKLNEAKYPVDRFYNSNNKYDSI